MKRIAFLIASILLLISCNNAVDDFNNEEGGSEEAFQIKLNMPDPTVVTYSAATENECYIERLWVLEFNGENLVNDTLIQGTNILNNGKSTQLLPQLPFKPVNGHRVVFIANADTAETRPHPNRSSIRYSNINTYFTTRDDRWYYVSPLPLPMYGEIASWPSGYSCEMIRAVAKIQVRLGENLSDVTGNFNAENVDYCLRNFAASCYIQPPSGTLVGKISDSGRTFNDHSSIRFFLQKAATIGYNTVYIHEFPTGTMSWKGDSFAETDFNKLRIHVLLDKNIGGTHTYYRLDFYDQQTKKFLDIRRNHHYLFTINSIRSEGYSHSAAAYSNPGSNIEYTVEVRDGASHITSNGQYAIVTSVDTAYVEAPATDVTIATARYQLPTGMSLDGGESTLINSISATGTDLTVHSPNNVTGLTDSDQAVRVTTTSSFTGGQIIFRLGNITHTLHVKKK
jgi:hypothetical protein